MSYQRISFPGLLLVLSMLIAACGGAATPTAAPMEPTAIPAEPTTAPAEVRKRAWWSCRKSIPWR